MAYLMFFLVAASSPGQTTGPSGPTPGQLATEYWSGFGAGTGVALVGISLLAWGGFERWAWGAGDAFTNAGTAVLAVAPAACGVGMALVGRRCLEHGSMLASVGGSYVGAAVGGTLFWYTAHLHSTGTVRNLHYPAAALVPFIVTSGAMLGYNLTRPTESIRDSNEDRLEMPALGFRVIDRDDGEIALAAELKLVGLRF